MLIDLEATEKDRRLNEIAQLSAIARRDKNILADIHTGMETIAQIITSEVIAIIIGKVDHCFIR